MSGPSQSIRSPAPAPWTRDRVECDVQTGSESPGRGSAIVSSLAVNESLTFNDLRALLQVTDGNLSVHARKLEDAQYIACDKTFHGRVPKTEYRLTPAGRKALDKYLAHMEAIIRAVKD